jgi:hypothetical protein
VISECAFRQKGDLVERLEQVVEMLKSLSLTMEVGTVDLDQSKIDIASRKFDTPVNVESAPNRNKIRACYLG